MNKIIQNFRTKLFAGIATLLPLYLTFIVIRYLFTSLETISKPILKNFRLDIPGLGIVLTLILIYVLGLIVTNFIGKKIFMFGEKLVKRVPIVNIIYTTLKQITDTFTNKKADAFDGVVYIQYPREGIWTMAFISGSSKDGNEIPYYHIFVPTTPNPTSGFFLIIPQAETIQTGLTVEEGLKIIISGGLLAPNKNPLT
ncbi:MAG: hypothetical protein CMG60_00310 [Candidatus Marinimicrobia bacterium]|mgnify:FL=1|nr:hypothetical protein [Candidatus Neomarinimicrobiota bacterium]|tara:strand:+ start:602 stop:1195 length:594 start_codon:yes stop_codon:yes gene_type:complete